MNEPKVESLAKVVLVLTDTIIKDVEKQGRQNEQWFLDYLDELNRLSVIY